MKLYFIKAKYTDGIYQLNDFFVGTEYKQDTNKMQDIDLKANDGNTNTIVNTILPDGTNVNDYSHIIVPEAKKIYEIDKCIYLNNQQTQIQLIEDVLIGNYQEIKDKKIRISRSNDESLFNGIHDIDDITVRPTTQSLGTSSTYTGQWIVYFIDSESVNNINGDSIVIARTLGGYYGSNTSYTDLAYFDSLGSLAEIKDKYPEVTTSNPLDYDYFNKKIAVGDKSNQFYQSIYYEGKIRWKFSTLEYYGSDASPLLNLYIHKSDLSDTQIRLAPDTSVVALAFPLEFNLGVREGTNDTVILPYAYNISEAFNIKTDEPTLLIRGVKIMNESQLFPQSIKTQLSPTWTEGDFNNKQNYIKTTKTLVKPSNFGESQNYKIIPVFRGSENPRRVYDETGKSYNQFAVISLSSFNTEITLDTPTGNSIYDYEPFKKYKVSIFGQDYIVSKKNLESLRLRFTPSMSNIEYVGYIDDDTNNVLFTGAYTSDIKWSMDSLALFNQENPTYKDQFNSNMMRKTMNNVVGAGVSAAFGAAKGGPVGAIAGAGVSLATGAMNRNFDLEIEGLRTRGLALKPDQILGNSSAVGLAGQIKYGILIQTITSDFEDSMKIKYELTGFPTTKIKTINELQQGDTQQFGKTKLVKGQLLETVRNKYITNEINKKLQEGVILI